MLTSTILKSMKLYINFHIVHYVLWNLSIDTSGCDMQLYLLLALGVAGVWWVKQKPVLATWSWTDRFTIDVSEFWPSFTSVTGPIREMSICHKGVLLRKWNQIAFLKSPCNLCAVWDASEHAESKVQDWQRERVWEALAGPVKREVGQFGARQFRRQQSGAVRTVCLFS